MDDNSARGTILPTKYWTDQGIVTDPSGYGW